MTYADDLVILCRKGKAEEALQRLREIMRKLKLTVNEEKTRICKVPRRRVRLPGILVRADVLSENRPGAPGIRVSSLISFADYLDVHLTKMHMRIGRAAVDSGEVGTFGYWLAVIQFVGFLVGGVAVFSFLRDLPTCKACGRYFRTLLHHKQNFKDKEEFAQYYDAVFQHPVDTPGFAEWMQWQPHKGKAEPGSILVVSTLRGCTHCKTQLISQKVKVMTAKEWKDVPELTRHVQIPHGIDLKPVFRPAC